MPRFSVLLPAALLLPCVVVAAAGYLANSSDPAPPARKLAEVEDAARDHLQVLGRATGHDVEIAMKGPAPCVATKMSTPRDEPWKYYLSGRIPVPASDRDEALDEIRQSWRAGGLAVTADLPFTGGLTGELSARDPATGISVTVEPTGSPDLLSVGVGTGCLSPAPGEDPGYEGI